MKTNNSNYFKFCPVCSGSLFLKRKDHTKRLVCRDCDFVFYQNSKPTASAFIVNKKGQILLAKRGINPRLGYWDAPGGFLENGEEPERGLKREMKEELGIAIKNIRFLGIYMDTYFERYRMYSLNIIFQAEIASGRIRPMDDVSDVKWFDKNKIPWSGLAFPWLKKSLREWKNSN